MQSQVVILHHYPDFPEAMTVIERSYQEMIQSFYAEHLRLMTQQAKLEKDREDYYTVWAHPIKTPISAVKLLLQAEGKEENRLFLAELFKIEQYTELVLQYLRMDSVTTDFMFQTYALSPLVKQVIRKYFVLFIQKKMKLEFVETEDMVLTDEKWLGFMIEQILSNAIKYTPAGGKIRIEMIRLGADCTLTITDTGMGIQAEDLPRVFEKGFTGYNGRIDKKSTGIGLYLCKKISEKLGHELIIQSEASKGTQVAIFLSSRKGIFE